MIDDLIFFEEEEYTNAKHIKRLESMIQNISEQLNTALAEISSLKQQLYDHINFQHDVETSNRFHITHIPKYQSSSDNSSSECILIDV
jgi:hypothetical protein